MKKLCAFILIALNSITLQSQTYKEYVQKADSYYNAKDYKLSTEYYEKAFKKEHTNSTDLYNGACSASLSNESEKAFKWLSLAIDNGYENFGHLKKDRDLEALHSQKDWEKLLVKILLK
jgi:hypothetical protein